MATKTKPKKTTAKKQTKTKTSATSGSGQEKKPNNVPLPGAFDLFKPSTNAFVLNIGVFLALYFIPVLIIFAGGLLAGILAMFALSARSVELVWMGVALFMFILLGAIVVGLIFFAATPYVQLKSIRQEKVGLSEAIRAGRYFYWRFWGLGLSVGFLILVGLILFIVPGLILIQRYFLAFYFLVDKDIKISEAMRASATATKGNAGPIWGVIGVNFLVSLTSIVPYIGGIISTVLQALYYCAPALRYEQLRNPNTQVVNSPQQKGPVPVS